MNPENPETKPHKSDFLKLFATGLLAWAVGSLILLGLAWPIAKPESASIAAVWAISYWWAAFAFGAVAMIAHGLISRLKLGRALAAYLLPAVLLAVFAGICQLIYPDAGFREDLFSYLPLILVFYFLGLLWSSLAKSGTEQTTFIRSVMPAMVGGIVILGLVAVPVFRSNAFIYHKAFDLKVSKRALQNGGITADVVLDIHKPGTYSFAAPRYIYSAFDEMSATDSMIEYGEITWGTAGEPKGGSTGSFPLQIRWIKNVPKSEKDLVDQESFEDGVVMEVRDPSEQNEEILFSIFAPLPIAGRE